jgi:replicative superfamily II helicase
MLVNSALEQARLEDLGVVVIDEIHMIDDPHRGYILEVLASKLRSLEQNIQIIGMSATISVSCSKYNDSFFGFL